MIDRKLLGETVLASLELAARELRATHPDLFERVDAIKAAPGWEPHCDRRSIHTPTGNTWEIRECPRCGERFVGRVGRGRACCSRRCEKRHARFLERRSA